MYTKEEENLIVLSCIEEISPHVKSKLIFSEHDKQKYLVKTLPQGVYNIVKEKFCDSAFRENALGQLNKRGITCITCLSSGYPDLLRHIDEPPVVLFCKGNVNLLRENCFSVVGSRHSTAGALALTKKICGELTKAFTVVTGTADGADSAAISGALPSGKIICVLANGFDHYYPAGNAAQIDKVAENGLIISEYLPHILPQKFNFPHRNRIIAGLSRGTLVVSAGEKSGALITADYALEYGREVFAFPYNIGVASGAGCNMLIKNGAYLTENILDIFSVFGLDLEKSEINLKLTADEAAVLEQMKVMGEGFLPVIAQNLKMLPFQLIPVFTSLEIKGLITRLGGNRYSLI